MSFGLRQRWNYKSIGGEVYQRWNCTSFKGRKYKSLKKFGRLLSFVKYENIKTCRMEYGKHQDGLCYRKKSENTCGWWALGQRWKYKSVKIIRIFFNTKDGNFRFIGMECKMERKIMEKVVVATVDKCGQK